MFVILYILIMVMLIGILTAINYKFKWVKRSDLMDEPDVIAMIVIGCLIWPLSLIVGFVAGIVYLFIKYGVPED